MDEAEVKTAMSKMSEHQRQVLIMIYERIVWTEVNGNNRQKGDLPFHGIPWEPSQWFEAEWTPTLRASISRTLRGLEARKLVMRNNGNGRKEWGRLVRVSLDQPPPYRTTRILITDLGRAVAKLLTSTDNKGMLTV